MRLAVEAYNRRDLDVVAIGYHPDLEYYPYREFVEAGLAEPCYHGPSGYCSYIAATYEVWGAEVRLEPTELIDLGDRLVLLADMPMRAQASGIPLVETYAGVSTLKDGKVIRNHDYLDQAEALDAAGLRERPGRRADDKRQARRRAKLGVEGHRPRALRVVVAEPGEARFVEPDGRDRPTTPP